MPTVITVQNLGKKYTISHQQGGDNSSLRETITNGISSFRRKLLTPFRRPLSSLPLNPAFPLASTSEDFWALKDVSFEVKQGDRVGIIGRNGAGKSTLLKILSRITEPTTGSIRIKGRVASLLEVGTGFHPELTGRENIFLNGAILGMQREEIRRKFNEIVDFAEIEKFLDTPVKHYSSGMYVRLAFAVAAHLEPEILIVDEVLAVGDSQFQKKCLGKMENVSSREGRTVLFVSHNLGAIGALCSKVILLEKGQLLQEGNALHVINEYIGKVSKQLLIQEWIDELSAPQNVGAVLQRVAICDNKGELIDTITTDTEVQIEIMFKVRIEGASIGLTLILYDSDNNCVFSSINNSEPSWYSCAMPVGVYRSACSIPGRFLNNRLFSVTINMFGKSFTDVVTTKEVLRFEVLDGNDVRRDFFGEYAGNVRPELKWTTEWNHK